MKKCYAMIIIVLSYTICKAQYTLNIEDLNTRFGFKLKLGQNIYYSTKNTNQVINTTFKGVNSQTISLGDSAVSPADIRWISLYTFHDNGFRLWCRNNIPNLHLTKQPSFDFETTHLAEIVADTTIINVDSNSFSTPTNRQLVKMYFPQLVYNFKQQLLSPFRASASQWKVAVFSGALFCSTLYLDKRIDTEIDNKFGNNNSFLVNSKEISLHGRNIGIGFVGCWLAGGLILNNNKATETALMASQAIITSTVWNRGLKYSTLRERPYSTAINNTSEFNFRGPKELNKLWNNRDYHSFGSGHAAIVFSIATVFAEQYKETPWVVVGSYTAAIVVSASRVISHNHWSSDVFVGALLGYACAKQITSFKKTYYINKASKFGINTTLASMYINNRQYAALSITAFVK